MLQCETASRPNLYLESLRDGDVDAGGNELKIAGLNCERFVHSRAEIHATGMFAHIAWERHIFRSFSPGKLECDVLHDDESFPWILS